jgi:hypothetical protein
MVVISEGGVQMTADSYGGWGNRETQAFSEVLQEDASLRGLVALRFATIRNSGTSEGQPGSGDAADAIRATWDEVLDREGDAATPSRHVFSMLRRVGSADRVNWAELGQALLDGRLGPIDTPAE